MDNREKIHQAKELLNGTSWFANFMGYSQRLALLEALRSEEGAGIADMVLRVAEQIKATPKTYGTEGQAEHERKVCLHYFRGGVDAYILERDVGDYADGEATGPQLQAYGKITVVGGGWEGAEWGYISIAELLKHGVELDLHFDPTLVGDMK